MRVLDQAKHPHGRSKLRVDESAGYFALTSAVPYGLADEPISSSKLFRILRLVPTRDR